jgi:hypothetical protein
MSERAANAMLALLEEEREVILAGVYDRLPDLGHRKERLFRALLPDRTPQPLLERLGRRTSRNQALLTAALSGLREAGQRRSQSARHPGGFLTYGSDGQRAPVAPGNPDFARKA